MPSKKETPKVAKKATKTATSVTKKATLKKPKNEPIKKLKITKAKASPKVKKSAKPAAKEEKVVLNNLNVLLMEKRQSSMAAGSKKKFDPDPTVTLPPSSILKARQRADRLLTTITHDFNHSVMKISYISAFCFLAIGTVLAIAGSPVITQRDFDRNLAMDSLESQAASAVLSRPHLEMFQQVPELITSRSQHTFSFSNAKNVTAEVVSLDNGSIYDLDVFNSSDDIYQLQIDPTDISSGNYELRLAGRDKSTEILHTKTVTRFAIEARETAVLDEAATTTESITEETEVTDFAPDEESEEEVEVEVVDTEVTATDSLIYIQSLPDMVSGGTLINFDAPKEVTSADLFLRPITSSELLYIGMASADRGSLSFQFNTNDFPDGEYVVIGKTRHDNSYVEIETNRFIINNSNITSSQSSAGDVLGVSASSTVLERAFADFTLANYSTTTSASIEGLVDEIIESNNQVIQQSFQRYSIAVQAKNPLLLSIAEQRLDNLKQELLSEILLSENYNDQAMSIKGVLDEQFDVVKKRIDSFEEVRRLSADGLSSDTDNDGISDVDEEMLFQTNPLLVDSDSDGIMDGVEVISGFDPLNPLQDVVVSYESPLSSLAPVDFDTLGIEAVLPVIDTSTDNAKQRVEIRGWSYPNSFVTLYIFSEPIVTKVKADDSGKFSYILDKELDDGEHEVYAAIVDNQGSIVLKTEPYQLVKNGQSLIALKEGQVYQADSQVAATPVPKNINLIAGLFILALGLVLLMLSVSLRRQTLEEELNTKASPA